LHFKKWGTGFAKRWFSNGGEIQIIIGMWGGCSGFRNLLYIDFIDC